MQRNFVVAIFEAPEPKDADRVSRVVKVAVDQFRDRGVELRTLRNAAISADPPLQTPELLMMLANEIAKEGVN